jgi:hypothetical protein
MYQTTLQWDSSKRNANGHEYSFVPGLFNDDNSIEEYVKKLYQKTVMKNEVIFLDDLSTEKPVNKLNEIVTNTEYSYVCRLFNEVLSIEEFMNELYGKVVMNSE